MKHWRNQSYLTQTILLITTFTLVWLHAATAAERLWSCSDTLTEAIPTQYTSKLIRTLQNWPPKSIATPIKTGNPVWYRAIETPEDNLYIGQVKRVVINAPISLVSQLIEDFEAYPRLFEAVKNVKIVARENNKVTVRWERYSPAFFIPNIKYELIYIIDHKSSTHIAIRYQLKSGNSVKTSDGIIVLESQGDSTVLTGYDFFSASFGLAGAIAKGKIWHDSLEGTFRGDLTFKFRAENPSWSQKEIKKHTDQAVKDFPIQVIPLNNPWSHWQLKP